MLRPTWHLVPAEDVRWTWQAQIRPDVAWDSADSKRFITDVEVVDPQTVRFHFSRVYSTQLLNANEGVILPKHVWEKLPFSQWRQVAVTSRMLISGLKLVANGWP